ncbi:MAG: MATE family efflux transporter [Treponema sp.]|nr:MATE family efflux transporter [Treponema sp.]
MTLELNENKKGYLKQILTIAIPLTLGNIISQVQMLTDRAFLGKYNEFYMSALGNVTAPVWTSMSVCFSLVMGASILISQKIGAKENEECERYASSLMKWINVLPLFLFFVWLFGGKLIFKLLGVSDNLMPYCMDYLTYFLPIFLIVGIEASTMVIMQTSNYTKPMVWFGLIRSVLNVILDWIFIFGKLGLPEMGIKGAAIATTIAEYAGVGFCLIIFVKSKKLVTRPHFKSVLTASPLPFLKSAKLGVNSALEDFAWNFGNIVLISLLNKIDDKAAGIYSMIFGMEILVVVAIAAFGNATMTLTSEATGAKDVAKYKNVCKMAYGLSAFCSVIMLIGCILFPKQIIGVFSKDANEINGCGFYLILMCVNLYAKSANIIIGNGIRGSGNTKWMFYTQIFGTCFIIGVSSLFVRVFGLGITGVFLAVIADELVRAVINFFKLRFIVKTKF